MALMKIFRRPMALTASVLLLVCCVSCDWPVQQSYDPPSSMASNLDNTVSVHELARRLGMTVDRANARRAVLVDSLNTVMITAGPAGRIFLNGQAIRHRCEVRAIRETLFVSASAEGVIGRNLRRPAAELAAPLSIVRLTSPMAPMAPVRQLGPVMIDPGHGGKDAGAIGVNGLQDKTVALAVGKIVARQLRARNVEVFMTRTGDSFVTLDRRCEMSNERRVKLFVSLHADSATTPQANGFGVFIARKPSSGAVSLANSITSQLASAGVHSRGVRNKDFRVLVGTRAPAVLVELGFLSNRTEAAKLARSDYQRRLADAIVAGIMAELRN